MKSRPRKPASPSPVLHHAPAFAALSPRNLNLLLASSAALLFLIVYLADSNRPGVAWPNGYYGWHDQGEYLDMLRGIPKGNLGAFHYPLGYPVLAFPLAWLLPADPFTPINMVLFIAFAWLSWRLLETLVPSRAASLFAWFALLAYSVRLFETPWTSTPSTTAFVLIFYLLLCPPVTPNIAALAGAAAGIMFASRVADLAVGVAVIAAFLFESAWHTRRFPGRLILASAAGCAAVCLPVLAVNYHLSRLILGPYYPLIRSQPINPLIAIPFNLYSYFIDPLPFSGETFDSPSAVLRMFPLILLAPPGFILLARKNFRAFFLFAAGFAVWLLAYAPNLALNGLSLRFEAVHYFKPFFPAVCVAAALAVSALAAGEFRASRVAAYLAALAAVVLLPRLLVFPPYPLHASNITVCCHPEEIPFALDGNPATRWTTHAPRRAGMSLEIDAGRTVLFDHIRLVSAISPGDAPRNPFIEVSSDHSSWREPRHIDQSAIFPVTDFWVDPVLARYIRLSLLTSEPVNWWSIDELTLYAR